MSENLVIILVKNITLGKVKTRLAKAIGDDEAFNVYQYLFNIIESDKVYFREKDFQQLKIVENLIKENFPNLKLVPVSTVRSDEGIALSSRNRKLSKKQMTDFVLFQKEVIQIYNASSSALN